MALMVLMRSRFFGNSEPGFWVNSKEKLKQRTPFFLKTMLFANFAATLPFIDIDDDLF
jgi:hypothetical protein